MAKDTTSAFSAGWAGSNGARRDALRQGKQLFVSFFEWFGELGLFCGRLARAAFLPPFEGRELVRQLDAVGSKSFPLVALAGGATGVVLSLQSAIA